MYIVCTYTYHSDKIASHKKSLRAKKLFLHQAERTTPQLAQQVTYITYLNV